MATAHAKAKATDVPQAAVPKVGPASASTSAGFYHSLPQIAPACSNAYQLVPLHIGLHQ